MKTTWRLINETSYCVKKNGENYFINLDYLVKINIRLKNFKSSFFSFSIIGLFLWFIGIGLYLL